MSEKDLKRPPSEENTIKVSKKTKKTLPPDPSKAYFSASLTQSDQLKIFWYLPSLILDGMQQMQSMVFESCTGHQWLLSLITQEDQSIKLSIELHTAIPNYYLPISVIFKHHKTNCLIECKTKHISGRLTESDKSLDIACFDRALCFSPVILELSLTELFNEELSLKLTGFPGLINEGNTCYFNSIIQSFFHFTYIRNAIYTISNPTSFQRALQVVFYRLQRGIGSVSAEDLLKISEWEQWNKQQDVHEISCKLFNLLDENLMSFLFEGQIKNIIQSDSYRSETVEKFYDIQLPIVNFRNIYESFIDLITEEKLHGDNQIATEDSKMEDGIKRCAFVKLPKVFRVYLKRFESYKGVLRKLNDYYEFYETLDLSFIEEDYCYSLFAVLVHSGNIHSGHYYTYIDPNMNGKWLKFNDAVVSPSSAAQAVHSNYGGFETELAVKEDLKLQKSHTETYKSAYMLIYVLDSEKERLFADKNYFPIRNIGIYVKIRLVSYDLVYGWDGPGLVQSACSFYKSKKKEQVYYYEILENSTIRDLRQELDLRGRIWGLCPSYTCWEFELSKDQSCVESFHGKMLYIEDAIFEQSEEEWKLQFSYRLEKKEECLIFLKWFDGTKTTLIDFIYLNSSSLAEIRTIFCEKIPDLCEDPQNIILHLESSSGNIENSSLYLPTIIKFDKNSEFSVNYCSSHEGSISVKDGDIFIGALLEGTDTYLKEYASCIDLECKLYDKLENLEYVEYSKSLLAEKSEFMIPFNLNHSQEDLVQTLSSEISISTQIISPAQIQLYAFKSFSSVPLPIIRKLNPREFLKQISKGVYFILRPTIELHNNH